MIGEYSKNEFGKRENLGESHMSLTIAHFHSRQAVHFDTRARSEGEQQSRWCRCVTQQWHRNVLPLTCKPRHHTFTW